MQDLKKIKLSALKKKIDDEYSLYIRRRDFFKCVTCGYQGREKDGIMQAGHLFTRAYDSTRYDDDNTHCQCRGCNKKHEYHPEIYTKWFIDSYGYDEYERLYRKHWNQVKYTRAQLIGLLEHYKQRNKDWMECYDRPV